MASTIEQEWTVLSIINWSAQYLGERDIDSPRLTAELLLSHLLNLERIELYMKVDRLLSSVELAGYKALLKRRLAHEPVQYILGETEFMGMRLAVDHRVLIPRPETELLVELVMEEARKRSLKSPYVLDIGTGSGCIAIAVAKYIPGAIIHAIDSSDDALSVAGGNIGRHRYTSIIALENMDILSDSIQLRKYDFILSNPPYISLKEYALLPPEIKDHEPMIAATDHGDGLKFYRRIATIAPKALHDGGCVIVEVAYDQAEAVTHIFSTAGFGHVEQVADYSKIPRIVKASIK